MRFRPEEAEEEEVYRSRVTLLIRHQYFKKGTVWEWEIPGGSWKEREVQFVFSIDDPLLVGANRMQGMLK